MNRMIRRLLDAARQWRQAAEPDDDAGRLDATAGCEFVNDRIRLLE